MSTCLATIVNATSGTVVAHEVHSATSFASRLRGLIFVRSLPLGHALWISPCTSVHSCFMRFPIDVIFVDADNIVVGLSNNLTPWRFSRIFRSADGALEVPTGTIAASNTRTGHVLEFLSAK
ncbi:MAG TPA: DUF192 domain-containing protein [Bacillota bacterium]|nr:DUF192 domain-containing protein [Bacillota bacterium]